MSAADKRGAPKKRGQANTMAAGVHASRSSSGHMHARNANSSASGATTRLRHRAASQDDSAHARLLRQSDSASHSGPANSRLHSPSAVPTARDTPAVCSPRRAASWRGVSSGNARRTGSHAPAHTWHSAPARSLRLRAIRER
jgi:hypothetical protein